ncbi:MFS general substrate transporter, partial [Auriscalpium vulgare]
VKYNDGDSANPVNFSYARKWTITLVACTFTGLSAAAASSYNLGFDSIIPALNCTQFQATVGLAVYPLGFGIVPIFTAPFSEELGRRPLYIVSALGFMLMHLMVAEAKNIQTVILARLLGGGFGSTGATMVGGSIADIWRPSERGLPMSIFAVAAVGSTGLGPVAAGWIQANPHLQWRWIQWLHVIVTALCLVLLVLFMRETRTSVILTRRTKKLRAETGDDRYRSVAEIELPSLKTLLIISCTRPLRLLLTEPVVASFSLWIGFAWGILYCMVEYVPVSPAHRLLNSPRHPRCPRTLHVARATSTSPTSPARPPHRQPSPSHHTRGPPRHQ